jgi:hypothetical protein
MVLNPAIFDAKSLTWTVTVIGYEEGLKIYYCNWLQQCKWEREGRHSARTLCNIQIYPQRRGTARTLPSCCVALCIFCVVLCIFVLLCVLFCDVPCIVCVYMCTEQLPPGGYQLLLNISYRIILRVVTSQSPQAVTIPACVLGVFVLKSQPWLWLSR